MARDEENQFKKLRYKNPASLKPEVTIKQMAERTGLAESTISKLEKHGADQATACTIKAYKHKIENVSYDYLMGDNPSPDIRYHEIAELFPFHGTFYKNLEELLALDGGQRNVEMMLSAFLNNPKELYSIIMIVFTSLHGIDRISEQEDHTSAAKKILIKKEQYALTESIIEFLENEIMPLLKSRFDLYEKRLGDEAIATEELLKDMNLEQEIYGNNATCKVVSIGDITVTPYNPKS